MTKVRNSDIAIELVEQLKATGPKIVRIIEANGDGDPAMLGALFKVLLPCTIKMIQIEKANIGVTCAFETAC